jgi:adenylate kinase family enzyme
MTRVAIIGNGGGGKSTLAKRMGAALGLPVYTVDDVQWQPGWARTPAAEVARRHAAWLQEPSWIIDGWGGWENIEFRFATADPSCS